jgi:hypothetical protein
MSVSDIRDHANTAPDFADAHPGYDRAGDRLRDYSVVREQASKRLSRSLFFGWGGV